MLLQQSAYSNITGTGSQVTPGFPHSQFRLRVASLKVRERGRTTPIAYELASDTYYGLGVVTACVGGGEGGLVWAAGREWCTSGDGGGGNVLVSRVKGWREWIHT